MSDVATLSPPPQTEPYVNRFKAFSKAALHSDPPWITQLRKSAMSDFAGAGFPTSRHEEWRFTDLSQLLALPFHPAEKLPRRKVKDLSQTPFFDMECFRLVFVDGHYFRELSVLPEENNGLLIGSLQAMLDKDARLIEKHLGQYASYDSSAFTALNTGFFQDGAFISVAAGEIMLKPVHLLFISSASEAGVTQHPRNLILADARSALSVVETYVTLGDEPCFTNAITEIVIGPDAKIEHCKIQKESDKAFHIATIKTQQERGSLWRSHSIAVGARFSRTQIETTLNGEGSECLFNGLYLGQGAQLMDHHTVVNHAKPHCESHEFYHGILDGHSHGVFNGKIFVHQDAQKTNAKQTNRNLLLSEDAVINTKPQLEIFADDVKCTHGATVGQLNQDAIFYLRARGIGFEEARRMLIHAFAQEVVDRIKIDAVRRELNRMLLERYEKQWTT